MSRSSQAFGGDSLSTTRSGAPATIARRWAAQVPMFRNGPPPHCTFHCKTDTSRSPGPGRSVAPEPVIVQADHPEYTTLTPSDLPGVRALVDGRAIVREAPWVSAGIPVARIGQPASDPAGESERPILMPGDPGLRVGAGGPTWD